MIKLFKLSFQKTNNSLILVIPFVIFISILSWYCSYALNSVDKILKLVLASITFFVMFCGFAAAWLQMVKKAIAFSDKIYLFDKDKLFDIWRLICSLPKGFGRMFVPIMGVTATYSFIFIIAYFCLNYFITKYIGVINLGDIEFEVLSATLRDFFDIMNELEPAGIKTLEAWYYSILSVIHIVAFLTMLWIPEIIYAKVNFLKALYQSVIKVFKHIGKSIFLYAFILFIVRILSILHTIFLNSPIAYFFVLLVTYYFIVYIVVLLFTYYEQNFTQEQ